MKIRAPLSYYGGKSKIAHLYPAPVHDLIVEPFAGSAAYAWLHRRQSDGRPRAVWLNDLDGRTYSIWKFLTSADASAIVEAYVPDTVDAGQKVSELIPVDYPGLREVCRAEANQGTQGAKGVHDQITSMGAKCWKVKRKLAEVIPEVKHWGVTNYSYDDLINIKATWFVDPPYSNVAGSRYRTGMGLDYEHLGWWCLNRKGQTIVAENVGATWGDFVPMQHHRISIRSRYQRANAQEAVWLINETSKMSSHKTEPREGNVSQLLCSAPEDNQRPSETKALPTEQVVVYEPEKQ